MPGLAPGRVQARTVAGQRYPMECGMSSASPAGADGFRTHGRRAARTRTKDLPTVLGLTPTDQPRPPTTSAPRGKTPKAPEPPGETPEPPITGAPPPLARQARPPQSASPRNQPAHPPAVRATNRPAAPRSAEAAAPGLRLYTATQAAELLQIPASWLRKKAAAGAVPHIRIGRHLRFSEADLREIIRVGRRPAQP
ncbi:helix-turn-helix domain-containing protein [Streptomyces sp. NPDC050315]|uniref:helix-turn-helix domain-containing protein n=1 Tax=Streptomyces sp. NPDC050315 TaxID=3155039 RepID=UPI00343540AC